MLQLLLISAMLGVGLAMDAFSISLANGLAEPNGTRRRAAAIATVFALFQAAMPLAGWVCVHTMSERFASFQKFIPYIALGLLTFIGGKMIFEGIKDKDEAESDELRRTTFGALLVQGVATSIDALSAGFSIAEYTVLEAVIAAAMISAVTFVICFVGVRIGRTLGLKLAWKASIFGGAILIAVGIVGLFT